MPTLSIRPALPDEDDIVIRHYRSLWESYGVAPEAIRPDAEDVTRRFIRDGREGAEMQVFFAEINGDIVGSIACQEQTLPYPDVATAAFRKHGYIWSVFVEASARKQGVASALVDAALDYLRSIGCTKAVLHSSDDGENVYRRAGFELANEMRLDL